MFTLNSILTSSSKFCSLLSFQTLESSQEETRQQIHTKETETEKLKKKVQDVTKEKDSKIAKIKLLLGNQKKLESQLKKCAGDFEEMVTINEDLKKRLVDRYLNT